MTTPDRREIIRVAIERSLDGLRTCMPGTITAWDPATRRADVKPVIKDPQRQEDDSIQYVDAPVWPDVPIHFLGSGSFTLTWPVAVGDACWIFFTHRDMSNWLDQETEAEPSDLRVHGNHGGAFAIPGDPFGAHPYHATDAMLAAPVIRIAPDPDNAEHPPASATKVDTELRSISAAFTALGGTYVPYNNNPAPAGGPAVDEVALAGILGENKT